MGLTPDLLRLLDLNIRLILITDTEVLLLKVHDVRLCVGFGTANTTPGWIQRHSQGLVWHPPPPRTIQRGLK